MELAAELEKMLAASVRHAIRPSIRIESDRLRIPNSAEHGKPADGQLRKSTLWRARDISELLLKVGASNGPPGQSPELKRRGHVIPARTALHRPNWELG